MYAAQLYGRSSVDLNQQAAFGSTVGEPSNPLLGTALLAPHGDGPGKHGLNKTSKLTWLAGRGQRASFPSG